MALVKINSSPLKKNLRSTTFLQRTLKNLRWANLLSLLQSADDTGLFVFFGSHQLASAFLQQLFVRYGSKYGFSFYRLHRSFSQLFRQQWSPGEGTYLFLQQGHFYCLYWPSFSLFQEACSHYTTLSSPAFFFFGGHFCFDLPRLQEALPRGSLALCSALQNSWEPLLQALTSLVAQLMEVFPGALPSTPF